MLAVFHGFVCVSYPMPFCLADAIEHIAERIMEKAAEQATYAVDRHGTPHCPRHPAHCKRDRAKK